MPLKLWIPALCALTVSFTGATDRSIADDDPHAGHGHTKPLHLTHPLVTESPLPENEARIAFSYAALPEDEGDEFTLTASVEFAPWDWFSIEVSLPLTHLDPTGAPSQTHLGNAAIGLKFATFALEDLGLLLAAGVEVGLPTGDEERGIGNDHVIELEPWLGVGLKRGRFEWIARIGAGFPLNTNGDPEADAELHWSTSILFHVIDDTIAVLVELDGLHVFGGEEDGYDGIAVTPCVRFAPFHTPDFTFGIGVRLPVGNDRDADVQVIFTVYIHY